MRGQQILPGRHNMYTLWRQRFILVGKMGTGAVDLFWDSEIGAGSIHVLLLAAGEMRLSRQRHRHLTHRVAVKPFSRRQTRQPFTLSVVLPSAK